MRKETELLLYLAARAQLVREKFMPALEKGITVICDRFEDSTMAYQGFGRNLSIRAIEQISVYFVREDLKPDLTIVLDIDPKSGMKRGGRHDRIESESYSFHKKVRMGFLNLARRNLHRYFVIDAAQSIPKITQLIQKKIDGLIK